ncbi:hypothetical protein N0V84_011635 [Fusarium piperis]|uniref:Uncharacterized protein n=1 Tax=Fusarium piperis TaxID=1435070 RepID=A0A9W8TA54_9HYPO|nr:hypothetical protein N0V84_011635 [Fusarium piperis]
MPRWPFSFSSLIKKNDRPPWNVAIIPYLELKQVLSIIPELPPSKAKYDDPPEISFLVQFTRLKLFLDAKLLDKNGLAWKELQDADPDFKMIRHLHHFAVYGSGVKEDGFPEEWKDENYFTNWLFVNVMTQLRLLDEVTLRRGTDIILYTDYVKRWEDEKQKYEENLEKQKRYIERLEQKEKDRLEKGRLALEKKQKKVEAKLLKDVHEMILKIHRKLRENLREMSESCKRHNHAIKQRQECGNVYSKELKKLDPENPTKDKERFDGVRYASEQGEKWAAKSEKERNKQDELKSERGELTRKLEHYESFLLER